MNQAKPLVACATHEGNLKSRIESAARRIGTDFFSSDDLGQTFEVCQNRPVACVVADYEHTRQQVEKLSHKASSAGVLLFAISQGDTEAAFRSATAGAIGVLEKPLQESTLHVSIKNALAIGLHVRIGKERFSNDCFNALTDREKDILDLLMLGEPNKRVASMLDIGLRTVEGDRAKVMKKLGASSFVELIKLVAYLEQDIANVRQIYYKNSRLARSA